MSLSKSIKVAFILVCTFFTINVSAQQNCEQHIREINARQSGIPILALKDYETCVTQLEANVKPENKELLKQAYRKLIQYFDAIDDQAKVDLYRNKLHAIETP